MHCFTIFQVLPLTLSLPALHTHINWSLLRCCTPLPTTSLSPPAHMLSFTATAAAALLMRFYFAFSLHVAVAAKFKLLQLFRLWLCLTLSLTLSFSYSLSLSPFANSVFVACPKIRYAPHALSIALTVWQHCLALASSLSLSLSYSFSAVPLLLPWLTEIDCVLCAKLELLHNLHFN